MKTSFKAILVATAVGLPITSVATEVPASCCPIGCKSLEGPVTLGATFVTADFSNGGMEPRTTPLARNVFYGLSPDENYHVCVRYTEFGDEEIKCVLTPMLM